MEEMEEYKHPLIIKLDNEIEEMTRKIKEKRFKISISAENFKELFFKIAKIGLLSRKITKDYVVDDTNRDVINQFYFYLTQDEKFIGDFDKGFLIYGNNGTGKTLLMETFIKIISELAGKNFTIFNSRILREQLIEDKNLMKFLENRPLYIDDLGKENLFANNYGIKETPVMDLLALRYDKHALTFITTNNDLQYFAENYGVSLADRMKEMFNFFEMKGESKR
jgi:DNA replication protein DnaC